MAFDLLGQVQTDAHATFTVNTPGEYVGPCPATDCNSTTDGFHVWVEGEGRYWCRKCGRKGDAIAYLREFHHLSFPDAERAVGRVSSALPEPKTNGKGTPGKQSGKPKVKSVGSVRRWKITEDAFHCRQDYEDGTKRMWWAHADGRVYSVSKGDPSPATHPETLPLYIPGGTLPANKAGQLLFVEGEAAADALHKQGFVVVATVCGAAVIPGTPALEVCRGWDVYTWTDNDSEGRAHMSGTARRMIDMGMPIPRWIEWAEAPAKGDAADLIDQCGPKAIEKIAELLLKAEPFAVAVTVPAPPPATDPVLSVNVDGGDTIIAYQTPVGVVNCRAGDLHSGRPVLDLELTEVPLQYLASNLHTRRFRSRIDIESSQQLESMSRTLDRLWKLPQTDTTPEINWTAVTHDLAIAMAAERSKAHASVDLFSNDEEAPENEGANFRYPGLCEVGGVTLLYGKSERMKSWLALSWALAIGMGLPFLGIAPAATTPGPVLFVDFEDDARTATMRARRILLGQGIDPSGVEGILHYLPAKGATLSDIAGLLNKRIKAIKPVVLIIDSVAMACGGNPADSPSATAFFRTLHAVADGIDVLLIGHVSKGEEELKDPFGSVFWFNEPRTIWYTDSTIEPPLPNPAPLLMTNRKFSHAASMTADEKKIPIKITLPGRDGRGVAVIERATMEEAMSETYLPDRMGPWAERVVNAVRLRAGVGGIPRDEVFEACRTDPGDRAGLAKDKAAYRQALSRLAKERPLRVVQSVATDGSFYLTNAPPQMM